MLIFNFGCRLTYEDGNSRDICISKEKENSYIVEVDWRKGVPTRIWIYSSIDAYQNDYVNDIMENHQGVRIGKCKIIYTEQSSYKYTSRTLCNKEIPIYSTLSVGQLNINEEIEIHIDEE